MWQVVVGGPPPVAPEGGGVVVVVLPGEAPDLPAWRRATSGRVAVLVGDPADPSVLAAASEMAAELGGRVS